VDLGVLRDWGAGDITEIGGLAEAWEEGVFKNCSGVVLPHDIKGLGGSGGGIALYREMKCLGWRGAVLYPLAGLPGEKRREIERRIWKRGRTGGDG
ncbi:MAG: hypothetical protein J7L61_04405, partial [Thermoplasmata archaeon]|nr:hypothetical protein [Thermoplasmata archaeon]